MTAARASSSQSIATAAPGNLIPIVLVPGIGAPAVEESSNIGSFFYSYWGSASELSTPSSPVLSVWPAGFASLHDRACEIFAQLKGGVVDYGQNHCDASGLARFGRKHAGLFPEWSADQPVHMVGHSLGGNTIRVLQYLLSIKAFEGYDTSADWILSVSTLNAPHNGTLAAYAIGQHEISAGKLQSFSVGHVICLLVLSCLYLGIKPVGLDLGLDRWGFSVRRDSWWSALKKIRQGLFVHSEFVETENNAFFETTVHATAKWNKKIGSCFPRTFYLSYVGTGAEDHALPRSSANNVQRTPCSEYVGWCGKMAAFACRRVVLSFCSALATRRKYRALKASLSDVDWDSVTVGGVAADGLVSTESQSCPQVGMAGITPTCELPSMGTPMVEGVWHVTHHGHDHLGIVPFPACFDKQAAFFSDLFTRLRELPAPQVRLGQTPAW